MYAWALYDVEQEHGPGPQPPTLKFSCNCWGSLEASICKGVFVLDRSEMTRPCQDVIVLPRPAVRTLEGKPKLYAAYSEDSHSIRHLMMKMISEVIQDYI